MKTLTKTKTVVNGNDVTITGKLADMRYEIPVQRVTVGYMSGDNSRWIRHIQLSNEAVFVKAFGNGFAVENSSLVEIAGAIEPKTSFAPILKKPIGENLTAEISSELNPDFQWQKSASVAAGAAWSDIEGCNSISLDRAAVEPGTFVRCVASSEAGTMVSNPFFIK
jgi:hypothetical protein